MNAYHYSALSQPEEDSLHKVRLLNIEQRPFMRVAKRLLSVDSLVLTKPVAPPTPPPDTADEEDAARTAESERFLAERKRWREDMLTDFALLETNITRIQLLRNSNERERERYATEKIKILETAQLVRENTERLKLQLIDAQNKLALRKQYDVLAEKITSNRMLRPREDQHAQLEKLNAEIKELEDQSEEYARTWSERREQFNRIKKEAINMQEMTRGEKEEAERKEGMEIDRDQDTEREGTTTKGETSVVGTPRPDATPRHDGGGSTPLPSTQEHEGEKFSTQQSSEGHLVPMATSAVGGSRAASPGRIEQANGGNGDLEMAEADATPAGAANSVKSEIEEGEEPEDERMGET